MLVDPPCRELIHAGNVSQKRRARAVKINAHEADAGLDDVVERIAQVFGTRIVLIQAHANTCRIDFYQFTERILQPTPDRNRTPETLLDRSRSLNKHSLPPH